jgi:hypothetical protein
MAFIRKKKRRRRWASCITSIDTAHDTKVSRKLSDSRKAVPTGIWAAIFSGKELLLILAGSAAKNHDPPVRGGTSDLCSDRKSFSPPLIIVARAGFQSERNNFIFE